MALRYFFSPPQTPPLLPPSDKMRWVHIMKQGEYYERGLTSLFHRLLSSYDTNGTLMRPLVLDIGMNIGWFSLYSRAHGHDVASFEPNPTMFLRMCESLEYNHWTDDDGSVTLWNYGLGATPGMLNLTMGKNPGGSSFNGERLAKKYRRTMPVSVTTLDSIASMRGWMDRRISLAKVDVEGFEDQVIEGGRRLLYNGNVENILMENSITNVTTLGRMLDTLYDAGYRVREILTVNGEPYHEDWWHTFNPMLEGRRNRDGGGEGVVSDQLAFLAKVGCNIWWQHERIASDTSK
jgi:FkbM family methyltransferase